MTTDVTYRGNVSDPGDNLTETITTNSTAGGGTLVNSFAYSYDANKNKLKETIGGPLNPYGFGTTVGQEAAYDAEDRLTDWHRDDTLRDLNYALSKVGDWNTFSIEGVTETRTHGNAHELTNLAGGANPGALTHDAKGNILTSPAHGSQTYTWDFDNQLMSATSGGTHDYYYDALGRRVMKHVAGEKKLIFVHDGQQIIAEYKYTNGVVQTPGPGVLEDASNSTSSQTQSNAAVIIGTRRGSATIQRKYVYSTYIDERCLMVDRTALGSSPAGTEELFYYHCNNLYSTGAMTDAAGLVQERYAYDAYGNILQFGPDVGGGALGTPITVSALGQPYTYTGRRLDDETENYHYRSRYYQAPLGRFLGRDRILYGDGYNMYAYVGGGPLDGLDPTGQAELTAEIVPAPAGITPKAFEEYMRKVEQTEYSGRPGESFVTRSDFYTAIDREGQRFYYEKGEHNLRNEAFRNSLLKKNWKSFEVHSVEEANGKLVANQTYLAIDNCESKHCYKKLIIRGHANEGFILLGSKWLPSHLKHKAYLGYRTIRVPIRSPINSGVLYAKQVRFVGGELFAGVNWCSNCVIELHGCYAGKGTRGQELVDTLGRLTGCRVDASSKWCPVDATLDESRKLFDVTSSDSQ